MFNRKLNIISLVILVILVALMTYIKERPMDYGINLENMDLTAQPGDNFYDFATLGWRNNNPMPPEFSRYGTFDKLGEEVLKQVQDIILDISRRRHRSGSVEQKVATIYNMAMDFDKRNADGITPVMPGFARVDTFEDIASFLGNMQKTRSAFWGDGVSIDAKDSEHYIFAINQGGIGLARDFMVGTDKRSVEIRKKYLEYMTDVFKMFGITDAPAKKVFDMEMAMARVFYPKEKLRDPHANYNKFFYDDFKREFAGFNWCAYFTARGITPNYIDVGQPEPLKKSIELIREMDAGVIRAYLKWRIANGSMTALGDEQYDRNFEFYSRVLSGTEERRPKWKDATMLVDSVLGEAVGQIYVKRHFPPEAKRRMVRLVENLRDAYRERIKNLDWMSDDTKEKAIAKLDAFRVKIGYPDKWRDLSGLEIKGDSLFADLERAALFEDAYWLELLRGRKVDRSIWYMNAQTVNAYYSPSDNEICFPAGILQPPFFDMNADDAFNYGAIGAVIGHEMTHGFDDSGRHFDKNGNMENWWTDDDATQFKARAKVMVDFFNKIEVLPGIFANGEFTLGENLADNGGVLISFDAFRRTGADLSRPSPSIGFTPAQRFFIAYAGTWGSHIREEEIIRRTKTGVHSLPVNRVNGILPHINAWYEAFDVTDGNKMFVAPENRVRLW